MGVATFAYCCCCINLRVGCLFLGYLELIGTIIFQCIPIGIFWKNLDNIMRMAYIAMKKMTKEPEGDMKMNDEVMEQYYGLLVFLFELCKAFTIAILIFCCVVVAIQLVFNILLISGLHTNNRNSVGAYLLYSFSRIFSWTLFVIANITLIIVIGVKYEIDGFAGKIAPPVFSMLVITGIMIYFWMVIRSQYCKMRRVLNKGVIHRSY